MREKLRQMGNKQKKIRTIKKEANSFRQSRKDGKIVCEKSNTAYPGAVSFVVNVVDF